VLTRDIILNRGRMARTSEEKSETRATDSSMVGLQRNVFALRWVSFFGGLSTDSSTPRSG